MDNLSNRIKKLKCRLNAEINNNNNNLQEKNILELSRKLDELINEYLEMQKDRNSNLQRAAKIKLPKLSNPGI